MEDQNLELKEGEEGGVSDWLDDPLGSLHDGGEGLSCKIFLLVCDADGFIKAHIPPRLMVGARYTIVC